MRGSDAVWDESRPRKEAYIALTIRNEQTVATFLDVAGEQILICVSNFANDAMRLGIAHAMTVEEVNWDGARVLITDGVATPWEIIRIFKLKSRP